MTRVLGPPLHLTRSGLPRFLGEDPTRRRGARCPPIRLAAGGNLGERLAGGAGVVRQREGSAGRRGCEDRRATDEQQDKKCRASGPHGAFRAVGDPPVKRSTREGISVWIHRAPGRAPRPSLGMLRRLGILRPGGAMAKARLTTHRGVSRTKLSTVCDALGPVERPPRPRRRPRVGIRCRGKKQKQPALARRWTSRDFVALL
jgi:hypothetical protein